VSLLKVSLLLNRVWCRRNVFTSVLSQSHFIISYNPNFIKQTPEGKNILLIVTSSFGILSWPIAMWFVFVFVFVFVCVHLVMQPAVCTSKWFYQQFSKKASVINLQILVRLLVSHAPNGANMLAQSYCTLYLKSLKKWKITVFESYKRFSRRFFFGIFLHFVSWKNMFFWDFLSVKNHVFSKIKFFSKNLNFVFNKKLFFTWKNTSTMKIWGPELVSLSFVLGCSLFATNTQFLRSTANFYFWPVQHLLIHPALCTSK